MLKRLRTKLSGGAPTIRGSDRILGSFPPLAPVGTVGPPDNYFIHAGYRSRVENFYYDDSGCADEWQSEVYQFAAEIAARDGLEAVCDVGSGSGYKLLRYFADRRTVGLDVPETVEKLKRRYPDREWFVADFDAQLPVRPDLVICSDVIEHLPDPDRLLSFVLRAAPRWAVFSTPERDLLRCGTHSGPPGNPAHVREWNFAELRAYLSSRFEVVEHFVSNAAQCTQCALVRPRRDGGT
jgi:SAM-dependent methyltransferase